MAIAPAPARPGLPSGPGLAGRIRTDDHGHVLVESLVALGLLGLVVPPILLAAQAAVTTSARLETLVAAEIVADDAIDRLTAAGPDLVTCPDGRHRHVVAGAARAVGWPDDAVSVTASARAEQWTDGRWRWVTDTLPCTDPSPATPRRLDVTVRAPDGSVTVTRPVVLVVLP